jgi:8-oxo-dGTP diphosphatase
MHERLPQIETPSFATPSVGVLVLDDNSVLLVCHGPQAGHLTGTYSLPAGRLEEFEPVRAAAVRELFEETGLHCREEDLMEYPENVYVAEIQRKDGSMVKYALQVFICTKWEGILMASDETSPDWIKIEKLSELQLLPNVQKAVADGLKFLEK